MSYLPDNTYVRDPSGTWVPASAVDGTGALFSADSTQTLFYDDFTGSSLDTTNLWTNANGTAPTISGGNASFSATVSTYHAIRSQDLMPLGVGYSEFRAGVTLETGVGTGAGRFWGLGTPAVTPAAAVTAQDGVGFEVDQAAGSLLAVTYSAGTRTTVATLTRPSDGALHRYTVRHRVTQTYWMIDGVVVASTTWPALTVQDLYIMFARNNAGSFTNSPVFTSTAVFVGDTSKDSQMISDGVVGARRARVTPTGALAVHTIIGLPGPSTATGSIPAPAYLSTAATGPTSFISAPGAGLSIYVTDMEGSNSASSATRVDFTEGSGGTVRYSRYMAASGGGFVTNLSGRWKLPANTALYVAQSAANQCYYTVNYYIAA